MSAKNPYQNTASLKKLVEQDDGGVSAELMDELRPRIRADCLPGGINEQRPCPWYGCKYHLGLDINEDTGSLSVRDVDNMPHTCDLDVAEIGAEPGSGHGSGITLEEVGDILDVTRERARQIEVQALFHIKIPMRRAMRSTGMVPDQPINGKSSIVNGHNGTSFQKIQPSGLADDDDQG